MKTERTASSDRRPSPAAASPAAATSPAASAHPAYVGRRCCTARHMRGQSRAQAGISCAPQVAKGRRKRRVHCGVDFLKVSLWLEWSEDSSFLDLLEFKKQYMQSTETDDLAPVTVAGMSWNLSRTGTRFFAYRLTAGDVTLLLSKRVGSELPSARLEIGSLTSQTDLLATLVRVRQFLKGVQAKILKEHVGELHLASDFIGVDLQSLGLDNRYRCFSSVSNFSTYFQHWNLTGVCLGKGDIMLRCYDKGLELKTAHHKQEVFSELWGLEHFDDEPVTRVEFQLRREVLREFTGLESQGFVLASADKLLEALASIWRYCTNLWARFAAEDVDRESKHQTRSAVSKFWIRVQHAAKLFPDLFSLQRKGPLAHKDEIKLRQQALGLLMSIAAFHIEDIYNIPAIIEKALHLAKMDFLEFSGDREGEFFTRMMIKRNAAILEIA